MSKPSKRSMYEELSVDSSFVKMAAEKSIEECEELHLFHVVTTTTCEAQLCNYCL